MYYFMYFGWFFFQEIKKNHPNAGDVYVMGHLKAKGLVVPRQLVREIIRHTDREGVEARKKKTITRRVYSVPCPNFLWHVDGNHKLIRWKFVVHAAIDGFSRLIMFLRCSTNNEAETVKEHFIGATKQCGWPIRIRSDYGGENNYIWNLMYEHRGIDSLPSPVVVGSSVHNERIERLNRDINIHCEHVFKPEFYSLEAE